jgi:hypothetical protein
MMQMISGLNDQQKTQVRQILHEMIHERPNGQEPAVLEAIVNISIGIK